MIRSRVEILDLLKEYKNTQHEWVYQFWMSESEWSGKRQAYYSNGVVLGKFREKDIATQAVLRQGVTDEALFVEIKQDLERNIKTLKNMDELDILYEARLNSDIKLLKELSIDKLDMWIKKNCRWIDEDTKEIPYTEVKGLLFLYYAFQNFNSLKDDPYCGDTDEIEIAYMNEMGKQSQLHKYGVIPVDAERELITIDPPRIYDKSIDKTFFTKNVPLHLLKQISEMITNKMVTDFAVRLVNEPGYEGRMYSEYIAEALEKGKVFDLINLGDYSVSKLYSERYEDCMWVVIDSENITFEELCENIEEYNNMIVTQVIHLEYFVEHGIAYISHLDHEYVFYTLDEYEKRMNDPKQKGEAMTRLKSFKIDHSKIPFDYLCEIHRKDINGKKVPVEREQFLCYVLESYFKHKELLNEYFQNIKMGV